MPCESSRVQLLLKTLSVYMKMGIQADVEFLLVSRTFSEFKIPGLNLRVIKYDWEGEYFNPAMAFNLGISNASYKNILITSPEIMPRTNVLKQFSEMARGNYICQAYDLGEGQPFGPILVNSKHRNKDPSFYFLGMFKYEDLEKINGWDEEYMGGYCFEDNDFGKRFVAADLKFEIKDEIQCAHQYHPRPEYYGSGWERNMALFKSRRPTFAKKGLKWVE